MTFPLKWLHFYLNPQFEWEKFKFDDFSPKVSCVKTRIKKALITLQHKESPQEWTTGDYDRANLSIKIIEKIWHVSYETSRF